MGGRDHRGHPQVSGRALKHPLKKGGGLAGAEAPFEKMAGTRTLFLRNHRQQFPKGARGGNTSQGGRVGPDRVADGPPRPPRSSPAARLGERPPEEVFPPRANARPPTRLRVRSVKSPGSHHLLPSRQPPKGSAGRKYFAGRTRGPRPCRRRVAPSPEVITGGAVGRAPARRSFSAPRDRPAADQAPRPADQKLPGSPPNPLFFSSRLRLSSGSPVNNVTL